MQAAISLDKTLKPEKNKTFGEIVSMVELADGALIAADSNAGRLIQFSEKEIKIKSLTQNIFDSERLGGLSLAGDDMLAVTNTSDSRFAIITRDGDLVTRMGQSGSSAGEISDPRGITYSSNRRIYIADTDNNRISVFGSDGVFISSFGKLNLKEEQCLRKPTQVYVDSLERVYVFEHIGKLIKRLDHKALKNIWGESLNSPQ